MFFLQIRKSVCVNTPKATVISLHNILAVVTTAHHYDTKLRSKGLSGNVYVCGGGERKGLVKPTCQHAKITQTLLYTLLTSSAYSKKQFQQKPKIPRTMTILQHKANSC